MESRKEEQKSTAEEVKAAPEAHPEILKPPVKLTAEREQFLNEMNDADLLRERKQELAKQVNDAAPLLYRLHKDRGTLFFYKDQATNNASHATSAVLFAGILTGMEMLFMSSSPYVKIAGAALGVICGQLEAMYTRANFGASKEAFHEFDQKELQKIDAEIQEPPVRFSF